MEPLIRWIRKEQNGSLEARFLLCIYLLCIISVGVGLYYRHSWIPVLTTLVFFFGGTGAVLFYWEWARPWMFRLGKAIQKGNLSEALGGYADQLSAAARNLEQTTTLLPRLKLEREFAKSIRVAGNDRLRTMLNLAQTVPGQHGMTFDQAQSQFQEAAHWLSEVRRLVEMMLGSRANVEEDRVLEELKSLVRAREAAIRELST